MRPAAWFEAAARLQALHYAGQGFSATKQRQEASMSMLACREFFQLQGGATSLIEVAVAGSASVRAQLMFALFRDWLTEY